MKIKVYRFFHFLYREGPKKIRQWELLDIHFTVSGHWYRLAIFLGSPSGSKMGFWKTDACSVKGVNYRIRLGSYFRCLTLMYHWRK